ncbi:MAG: hypothetical protein ACOZIN_03270 [Myxococcota bacterium]
MAKAETYDELIYQLGDLARERLVNKPNPPRSMDRVLRAEDTLVQRRDELEDLETQMNGEDVAYRDYLVQQEAERTEQQEIVKKWKKAVDAVAGRAKEIRKSLSGKKAAQRYEQMALKKAEERHKDLEVTAQHDEAKVNESRENLKKLRLMQMRKQREIEEIEAQLDQALTPRPGQPGAQGVLAYKRLLEMDDEAEARKHEHEQLMAELDEAIAAKEEEVAAAEDYLEQALFLLGEECYQQRVADPALAAFYPRLDKVN